MTKSKTATVKAKEVEIAVDSAKSSVQLAKEAKRAVIDRFAKKGVDVDILNTAYDMFPSKLTANDFYYFCSTAFSIGANLLAKEMYAAPFKNRQTGKYEMAIIVADSFLDRKAKEDPKYLSVTSDVVFKGDDFKKSFVFDSMTGFNVPKVEHEQHSVPKIEYEEYKDRYGKPKKRVTNILGAWAIAYRKDSCPIYFFAPWESYADDSNGTWVSYPSAMILKCAESRVKKRLFVGGGLGVYTEGEISKVVMDVDEDGEVKNKYLEEKKEKKTKKKKKIIEVPEVKSKKVTNE